MIKKKTIFKQDKSYSHSETYINVEVTDVKEILTKMIIEILNKIAIYQRNGSGWYFKEVLNLEIHTVDYKPMRGSSYIPHPDFMLKKKAITNIQNKDEIFFLWCVLRYLYPTNLNDTRSTDSKQKPKLLKLTKEVNNKNFIKQSFAIFVKKNYTMTIQQAKCLKSETIVTLLESIVVQHITFATFNIASR